jgi:hypothetical protein
MVAVTWVLRSPDGEAFKSLTDAFAAYAFGDEQSNLNPANTAVELTLSRRLSDFLGRVASGGAVRDFLKDGATYHHQRTVLLPALLRFTDAPRLPDEMTSALSSLNTLRKQLAHEGQLKDPLSRKDAAKYICASLFAVHYLRMARSFLMRENE